MNSLSAAPKKLAQGARLADLYATVVALSGTIIFVLAVTNLPQDRWGLLIFAASAAVAELGSVELFSSSRSSVSVASIISVASMLLMGPWGAVCVALVSSITGVIHTRLQNRQQLSQQAAWWRRLAFNSGMFVITTAAGGFVYVLTGGRPGEVALLSNVLPLLLAVTADTLLNVALLIGMIALQTKQAPRTIWQQDFQWSVPISIIGGVIGGGALALACSMFALLGFGVFLLPVLMTSYSFRLYVKNTSGYVEQLEDANRNLDETNLGLLETLGVIIDADDSYTYGHSAQVSIYAEAIAEQLGLSAQERGLIVKAALVHDIGKIGVMDSIVSKQGPLTVEEYNLMKRHPVIGAEIIGRMKGFQDLVPIVRHHHERWDGTGYPDGLVGSAIPLGARVLTVADAVDAMCSDRPYRPQKDLRAVIEEIERCSDKQFDPAVVKAFLAVAASREPSFFRNSASAVDRTQLLSRAETWYVKKSMTVA